MAVRTCDGSASSELHADPVEIAIPCWSRSRSADSASRRGKETLSVFGSAAPGDR